MSVPTQILIIAIVVTVTFLALFIGAYVLLKRSERGLGPLP